MAKRSKPESAVVAEVLSALKRVLGIYAWRNNTGCARIGRRFVRFGQPGSADILCCHAGRFVAFECKSTVGRQSPMQRKWQAEIEAAGGRYCVVRSATEALEFLAGF